MKRLIHFFVLILLIFSCFQAGKQVLQAFAIDGEIVQYDIFDEEDNLLTFSSEVEIGDTILTRDFVEYQVYKIEGQKCYARQLRKLNKPSAQRKNSSSNIGKAKKLCLYMTHNDESYTLSDGYDSIYGAGGIHDVAKELQSQFQHKGIEVVLDETLHIPHNSSAYTRSGVTATSLFRNENPDALFDIHRDGVSRSYYLTSFDGQPYSKVRIVVGKSNPNFEENYKFAQEVFEKGNEMYPWLFLDVYCGKGHYNQELMSTNLLFEMGTYLIEKEYVLSSVPYLADVVKNVMYSQQEENNSNMEIEKEPESIPQTGTSEKKEQQGGGSIVGMIFAGGALAGLLGFAGVSYIRRKRQEKRG